MKRLRWSSRLFCIVCVPMVSIPNTNSTPFYVSFLFQPYSFDFSIAWLGIILLIVWEAYINSPLFERAAPLAPVVFELVTKKL